MPLTMSLYLYFELENVNLLPVMALVKQDS